PEEAYAGQYRRIRGEAGGQIGVAGEDRLGDHHGFAAHGVRHRGGRRPARGGQGGTSLHREDGQVGQGEGGRWERPGHPAASSRFSRASNSARTSRATRSTAGSAARTRSRKARTVAASRPSSRPAAI